jgi:hypothetical protein
MSDTKDLREDAVRQASEPTVTMNYMGAPKEITQSEALAMVLAAHEEVARVCHGRFRRGASGRDWTMSIPARADDSDLLIGHALSAAEEFLKAGVGRLPRPAAEKRFMPGDPGDAAVHAEKLERILAAGVLESGHLSLDVAAAARCLRVCAHTGKQAGVASHDNVGTPSAVAGAAVQKNTDVGGRSADQDQLRAVEHSGLPPVTKAPVSCVPCPVRRAAQRLEAVRSNHEAAGRIGTTEALECIDISEWYEAVEQLQQALAQPCPSGEPSETPCNVCGGKPLAGGHPCICGGRGTEWAEAQGLRERLTGLEIALGFYPNVPRETSEVYAEVQNALASTPRGEPSEAQREIAIANVAFLERHGEYQSNYTSGVLTKRVGPKHYDHYQLLHFGAAERAVPQAGNHPQADGADR